MNDITKKLYEAVIEGEEDIALEVAQKSIDSGMDPLTTIKEGIQAAMDEMGERFEEGEAFLPELMLAGDAATCAMDLLLEKIKADGGDSSDAGTVVLGVMSGDHHDIGKNLVKAILSANSFKVIDLGIDVGVKKFIETAKQVKADIIACSTLITTSLPYQKELIDTLAAMGIRNQYKVILGGGPVTPQWTKTITADGYSNTASECVVLCKQLIAQETAGGEADPIIIGAIS
ncbi:MAG: corrinoid protein [Spirochaetia bacterium]|nr:corrinoid protein [Spirochaetia bacterium]